jgi:hypothetical protein
VAKRVLWPYFAFCSMHVWVSGGEAVMAGVKYEWEWHKAKGDRPKAAFGIVYNLPL